MGRKVITGLTGIQELEPTTGYKANIGFTVQKRYLGRREDLQGRLDALVDAGGVVDASIEHHESGFYRLEVAYSASAATDNGGAIPTSPNAVVTTWSRVRSRGEKSLWTLRDVVDALSRVRHEGKAGSDEDKAQVRADIESFFRREIGRDDINSYLAQAFANDEPALRRLMASFAAGEESYAIEVFVIRRTQVGPIQLLQNDDATINRVWTRDRLIGQSTFPAWFASSIPPGVFLQTAAELTQQDLFRWQSVQEWDHADTYSDWIYPLA